MVVKQQQIADAVFEDLVDQNMHSDCNHSRKEAEVIERENLGYFAGYYNMETRERVEKLFDAIHPIFGPVSGGAPTASQAFEIGLKMGQEARDRAQ